MTAIAPLIPALEDAGALGRLRWVDVCPLVDLVPERGVCAVVGRSQVAVFRTGAGDEVLAVSNYDPFSKAFVMSRGMVGSKGDRLKVVSPVYKQGFDLRTGQCLDDPEVALATFECRVVDGMVQAALPTDR